jgi:hypothetical protein
MKAIFGILVSVLAFGASCNQSISEKVLPGTYYFKGWSIQDSLFVATDYTYKHDIYSNDGKISRSSGKWSYDSLRSQITFEKFSFPNDEIENLPAGYWVSRVRVTDKGEIHLIYSAENNIYFVKKPD